MASASPPDSTSVSKLATVRIPRRHWGVVPRHRFAPRRIRWAVVAGPHDSTPAAHDDRAAVVVAGRALAAALMRTASHSHARCLRTISRLASAETTRPQIDTSAHLWARLPAGNVALAPAGIV